MEVRAIARDVRMSPRKVRLVVDLVRGKPVDEALTMLRFVNKAAAKPVAEVIKSAVANAEHNYELNRDDLFISRIYADDGKGLPRNTIDSFRPRSRGMAHPIIRRTCHITVVVDEKPQQAQRTAPAARRAVQAQ